MRAPDAESENDQAQKPLIEDLDFRISVIKQ